MARSFKQELVGVFGHPVAENPTQAMVEAAFAAMGLEWRYLTVEVFPESLADAVRGAVAMNWRGFNCTIPHKVAVLDHLDHLTSVAAAIGAVNCVRIEHGRLLGDNTDGRGFLEAVTAVRPVEGTEVVVLGAGGASRAIAVELGLAGARSITIVNRDDSRGQALAQRLADRTPAQVHFEKWEGKYQVPASTDILVQATSIGLYPDVDAEAPVDLGQLGPGTLVADVIPNPPRTRLIRQAEARGCQVIDGLAMLVNQGVIGIQFWTGRTPDSAVMRRALEEVFAC